MKIARVAGADGPFVGYLDGEEIVPVVAGPAAASGEAVLALAMAVNADPDLRPRPVAAPVPAAAAHLLAPVAQPPAFRDFDTFERHATAAAARSARSVHPLWFELPVFHFAHPSSIVGPDAPVAVPPRCGEFDFELEVGLVLGRGGRDIRLDDVSAHVAGFCVLNDFSARDVQRREMAVGLGPHKGKDSVTAVGPLLVTASEFAPGGPREVPNAIMTARVNGVEYSRADLAEMYWSFAEMVVYAAEAADVAPGDLFGSGTCGTGCILELSFMHGSEKYPWLTPGDTVELEVDGLGVLRNLIVASTGPGFVKDAGRARPRYLPNA
jgi:2-keto-4-pentenoate hydratase/2-oxohepta-3-ene-1,7-dioic acid hydratase in catechol pathway